MTEVIAALRIKREADTGAEVDGDTIECERLADQSHYAVPQGDKIGISGAPCQNNELVSAKAENVLAGKEGREPLGNSLQHRITVIVPEEIIDLLEAVEIDAEHGVGFLCPLIGHRLCAYGIQKPAVRQFGQRVVTGDPVYVLFGLQPAIDLPRKIPDPQRGINQPEKPGDIKGEERMVQRIVMMLFDESIQPFMPLEEPRQAEEKQEDREPGNDLHLRSGWLDARHMNRLLLCEEPSWPVCYARISECRRRMAQLHGIGDPTP
ncbi:hypothetical protein HNR29_001652 [Rhizobium leguminosarum]|nr:hypothetical protein [Rhizobium leguminosarum]